jgi:hypothetical protein
MSDKTKTWLATGAVLGVVLWGLHGHQQECAAIGGCDPTVSDYQR